MGAISRELFIRAQRVGGEAALAPEVREHEVLVAITNTARHSLFAESSRAFIICEKPNTKFTDVKFYWKSQNRNNHLDNLSLALLH